MASFSAEAEAAIDAVLHTTDHVFITGKAGTGKSTLLEHIRLHTTKRMVVVAPTGIAAVHVNGDTIHSFFSLKPGFEKDEAKNKSLDEKKIAKLKRLEVLAIDEISMVRADLLDAIDIVLRRARKVKAPFGGVQLVFLEIYFNCHQSSHLPIVSSLPGATQVRSFLMPTFFVGSRDCLVTPAPFAP